MGARLVALATFATPGCTRVALEEVCADLAPGQLAITEVRGAQTGSDTLGQWIELHNPGGSGVELSALRIEATPLDGSEPLRILVRRDPLTIPTGGYLTVGRVGDDDRPAHIDYGYTADPDAESLPAAAIMELVACEDVVIDEIVYRDLPGTGTLALDGNKAPTADANDDETCWCNDATEPPPMEMMTDFGIPGTPQQANPPCMEAGT